MYFEELEKMSDSKLNELAAEAIGLDIYSERALYHWFPCTNMNHALELANKFGIALIPQSGDDGFRWYACDISSVSYRGSEIAIKPLDGTELSQDTAARAITICAIISKQKKENKNDNLEK